MEKLTSNTIGGGNKWKSFKEWLEEVGKSPKDLIGTYPVVRVFPPQRFPTATLVFWVDDKGHPEGGYGVKKAISPREWAVIAPLFTEGKVAKGFVLFLSFEGGEYAILKDTSPEAVYVPANGGGWELA